MKTKLFIALALLSFSFLFAQIGETYREQAQSFLETGYNDNAEVLMEKAIAQDPNNYDNYLVMFKVQMAKGNMQEAYVNLEYYVDNATGFDYDSYDNLLKLIEESVIRTAKGLRQYRTGYFPQYLNSEYSDHAPALSMDGDYLYFTSGRKCKALKENIFVSKKLGGDWGKPQPVTTLLTNHNESLNSFSADGKTVYLFGHYDGKGNSGIYQATKVQTAFTTPERINEVSSDYNDLQPYVFEDEVMFFTSNRPGSMGGYDIWVSEYSNGWQEPVNLGATINTINDEQTPFVNWDGQTLFFASNGHSSFGGLDIFKAKKSGDSWTEWDAPINLGPEINTIFNDRSYYRVHNSNEAFISSDRLTGKGAEDIYKIVILNEEYFTGMDSFKGINVYGEVVDNYGKPVLTDISWIYTENGEEKTTVVQTNNCGYYNIYLPIINSVDIEISTPNYHEYSNSILFEEGVTELNYNIEIELLEEKSYVIKDIYFDFDKSTLKPESHASLDKLAVTLLRAGNIEVCIVGYTDNVGSAKYNQKLSEQRANTVYKYLIEKGVNQSNLNFRGEGQDNPKADNETEENRQLNRRVEFKISKGGNLFLEENEVTIPADNTKTSEITAPEVVETVFVVEENVIVEKEVIVDQVTIEKSKFLSQDEIKKIVMQSKESKNPFFTEAELKILTSNIVRKANDNGITSKIQVQLFNNENRVKVVAVNFEDGSKNTVFEKEIEDLLNGWYIPEVTLTNYVIEINPVEE